MKRLLFIVILPLIVASCGGESPATQNQTPNAPQELQWDKTTWDNGDWG